ncbi:uncharacterized protein LOC144024114 [Festucalex cinctus]
MANTHGAEGGREVEAPESDVDEAEAALLHFGKYNEARRARPWEQWSSREKANYYIDRFFFGFLVVFLLVLLAECAYKMWYVTNVRKIVEFASDAVAFLIDRLLAQEGGEELAEL